MSQHFEIQSLVSSFIWADGVLLLEEVITFLYDYVITLISSTQNWIKDGIRQNKRSNHIHVVSYQVIVITFVTIVVVASYLISWIIRKWMVGRDWMMKVLCCFEFHLLSSFWFLLAWHVWYSCCNSQTWQYQNRPQLNDWLQEFSMLHCLC